MLETAFTEDEDEVAWVEAFVEEARFEVEFLVEAGEVLVGGIMSMLFRAEALRDKAR